MTSGEIPWAISRQLVQVPHGSIVGPFLQLTDLAKILALEVLPQPLGPVKK